MPVTTPQDFVEQLEKSKLLTPDILDQVRRAAGNATDPVAVARKLIQAEQLTKWQAQQLLRGQHVLQLGQYRLLNQIGKGKSGHVYLAEQPSSGRRVAVKVLPSKLVAQSEVLDRCRRQAALMSSVAHPNVAACEDMAQHGSLHFFSMAYVSGQDLKQLIQGEGPLHLDTAVAYLRQVAEGLHSLHEQGIVHGSIAPGHLLIDGDGTCIITGHCSATLAIGTTPEQTANILDADYLAPEQTQGDIYDHPADIYALGCAFYFLLTGNPPFPTDDLSKKLQGHREELPPSILEARQDVPADLVKLCIRMMVKDPGHRLDSARSVLEALDAWQASVAKPGTDPTTQPDANQENMRKSDQKDTAEASSPSDRPTKSQPDAAIVQDEALAAILAAADIDAALKDDEDEHPGPTPDSPEDGSADAAKSSMEELLDEVDQDVNPAASETSQDRVSELAGDQAQEAAAPRFQLSRFQMSQIQMSRKTLIIAGAVGGGVIALAVIMLMVTGWFGGETPQQASAPPSRPPPVSPLETTKPKTESQDKDSDATPPQDQPAGNEQERVSEAATDGGQEPDVPAEPTNPPAGDQPEDVGTESPPIEDSKSSEQEQGVGQPSEPPEEKDPFKELGAQIDLPPADGTSSVVALGNVGVGPDETCRLELLGGAIASGDSTTFLLQPVDAKGNFERAWDVLLGSPAGDTETIARFSVDNGKFRFQWSLKANEIPKSDHLKNCALKLSSGDQSKTLALRSTSAADPVTLQLDRAITRHVVEVECLPDPASLQIEFYEVEGNFPPHEFKPASSVPVSKGTVRLLVGEEDNRLMEFEIEVVLRGSVQLAITSHFKTSSDSRTIRYTKANATRERSKAEVKSKELKARLDGLKKASQTEQKRQATQMKNLEKQIASLEVDLSRLKTLGTTYQKWVETVSIHLRIFHLADGHQVELARSQPADDGT